MKVRKFEGEYWIKKVDIEIYLKKLEVNISKQFSVTALEIVIASERNR